MKEKNALILSTIFVRKIPDSICNFTFDYAQGLSQIFKHIYVLVPHSDDNFEKDYEKKANISIERFTYFFKNSWQSLCYRFGIPQNLKKFPLAWLQIPFFLVTYSIKTLKYRNKIDIIYCHWTPTIIPALILKWLYKKKIVVIIHGSDVLKLPKIINKFLLKQVDVITTSHSDLRKILKKDMKIKKDIRLIRNFTDETIPKLEPKKESKSILFFSRLADVKNPLFFLKIAKATYSKNKNIKFIMAGDGELKDAVKKYSKINNLKNFTYLGASDNVKKLILKSKAILFCAKYQSTFSTTLLETILMHKPVILNDIGENLKYFKHNESCIAFKNNDIDDCTEKLIKLFSNEYNVETLTNNAYKTIGKERFLNKNIIKDHNKYLKTLMKPQHN